MANKQFNEDMKFADDSRPDSGVTNKLVDRETPFKKVDFPEPDEEGYNNYEELLASDEYTTALGRLSRYTGVSNIGTGIQGRYYQLSMQASRILSEIQNAERNHEAELEELCERLIREHFKVPENRLQFDIKLQSESIQVNQDAEEDEVQEQEEELVDEILNLERAKRRLLNAMTQGHAVDGTWMFEDVIPEIQRITGVQNLTDKYAIFVSTMMLGYWQFPEEMMEATISEAQGAGKTRLDSTTNPPTVIARAVIFPFLIHETIKGVMEFLSKQRNPEDPERVQKAMDLEDTVLHEIWDIRLGPAIWRRLYSLYPEAIKNEEEKKKLQYFIYSNVANLPVKEFLVLMKEVIGNTEMGKKLIGAMYYDLTRKVDSEEVTQSTSEFRKLIEELAPKVSGESLQDMLSGLGISLSGQ
jgi:hypothetical protein